ncbi:FecR family protein [Spirosoma utsteinense]|uniref:Ferric-dicitrate binding protein FerR (Iron transport regulator) n=1 Tax=Spirosoma utsteinense TaxID=2585773 RepID=A0ABR6W4G3_9BACT|nr:FecR family protein [Spirosoma utsteinense]MBC3788471.1 ferric-dicitrate binding protein FerR (iron transport regulator) [Spirosoma utsteinense]MBC3791104.1 ferric-dicitrate binding protein FerR (iron transport regulator) [Spirosoma utsteinense]
MLLPPGNLSTIEDFLENDAFRTWVLEKRTEDQLVWQQWLAEHPEKFDLYEQAVAVFLTLHGKEMSLTDQQINVKTQQILDQLPDTYTPVKPLISWQWGRWVAAASILSVLIWWQLDKPTIQSLAGIGTERQATPTGEWKVVKNKANRSMTVLLPEQSSVLLSANSQIRFRMGPTHDLREVYLQGEGFFEVAKNPAKPFLVYTNRLTTRVTGTSFQIRSFANESDAFVKVKTGNVTVTPVNAPGSSQKEVRLAVNQQLNLNAKTDKVETRATQPLETGSSAIISQPFKFDFTPVPDVLTQLEAAYHMPIVYDRKLLKNCTFTGQLNDVPFLEKIRLICQTIESSFDVVNNQVIIESAGCN